jgi:hypothetical protein
LAFWWPLPAGYGFIGGDLYDYYFPLKHFYAEGLRLGEFRFWHPGIGNGVPVLAESQTGVFYPFHLIAYRLLDLNDAYNASFLSHYVLAYVFTFWLARAIGLSRLPAFLTANVFVYGWFPPRANLEWSIVTGAWIPLIVLAVMRWVETGRYRWAWLTALAVAVQLLAGHFQIAFITLLAVLVLIPFVPATAAAMRVRVARKTAAVAWIAAGYLLAAPQLLPTWELKVRSQRAQADFSKTVRYGRIPPLYLIQCLAPYWVYPEVEEWLRKTGGDSNKTEAHFYVSYPALILIVALVCSTSTHCQVRPWLGLIIVGLIIAIGALTPIMAVVPGFSYFRYPGRYGVMAQLGAAVLAGISAHQLLRSRRFTRSMVLVAWSVATLADLYWVGRHPAVQYVTMTKPPVISRVDKSHVFRLLRPTDRVLAINSNTLALSGASCVPPYLGLGPVEYYDLWSRVPDVFHGALDRTTAVNELIRLLTVTGTTHILTEQRIDTRLPMTEIWSGYDGFLHPCVSRPPSEPFYLYRFDWSPGRAYLRAQSGRPLDGGIHNVHVAPHRVVIECEPVTECELVLTDLMYPGWRVTVDNVPAAPEPTAMLPLRAVRLTPGSHTVVWRYTPWMLYAGCAVSLVTQVTLGFATFGLVRSTGRRHKELVDWPARA